MTAAIDSSEEIKRHLHGPVQFADLCPGKRSYVMREISFAHTRKVVAHYPARVFQPFARIDRHLSGQTLAIAKHRSTDYGREFRVDKCLTAYHYKCPILFRIVTARLIDAIQVASSHCPSPATINRKTSLLAPGTQARLQLPSSVHQPPD